jgi:hypothetical protein
MKPPLQKAKDIVAKPPFTAQQAMQLTLQKKQM